MNDSTENTNELDSYGVWVKNNPSESTDIPEADTSVNDLETSDSLDFSDALDLPDFDTETDFATSDLDDIFNDADSLSEDTPLSQDDDTTLNSDELLNITNGADLIETESDQTNAEIEDSFNFDDSLSSDDTSVSDDSLSFEETVISNDELSLEDSFATDESLSDESFSIEDTPVSDDALSFDDSTISDDSLSLDDSLNLDDSLSLDETPVSDDALSFDVSSISDDSLSLDDSLNLDDSLSLDETPISDDALSFDDSTISDDSLSLDDASVSDEAVSFGEDEEISLDDFMDGGFSDESVAAGNNGYEPGAPNSPSAIPTTSGSEEISLDDFIEGGFEADKEKEEEILDEKPLEMDISFDSSADTVKTEANFSIDHDTFDDDIDSEDSNIEEEINTNNDEVSFNSSESFEAEEIDLSDFGIDANAEETPVTQDIEASKGKEQQVDYDLTVENDNAVSAPIVNEIKNADSDISETSGIEQASASPAAAAVDMSLLQQIVADLTSLKDEINSLKSNLHEMKNQAPEETSIDDLGIVETKDEGGFFGSDDTDDTIALSTDELSNIMTTASISEEIPSESNFDTAQNLGIDIVEEPSDDIISVTNDIETAPEVVEEAAVDVIEETAVTDEDISFENPIEEDLSLNFSDENLEEPNLDMSMDEDISVDITEDDDLPQEIEIEKEDILVESSSSDFMDSISDSSEPTLTDQTLDKQEINENTEVFNDSFAENPLEDFSSINEVEDSLEVVPADDSAQVEDALVSDEPVMEGTSNEEVTFTDVFESEPAKEEENFTVVEDTIPSSEDVSFATVEDSFATVADDFTTTNDFAVENEPEVVTEEEPVIEESNLSDDSVSDDSLFDAGNVKPVLTDSNINYLTSDDSIPAEMNTVEENAELKKDIKSVLLYMDQLLENLPEDKIVEFAKSEEFTTYKKLFSELGLN